MNDAVVLKDGTYMIGRVRQKEFTIRASFGSDVTVPVKRILQIHFKSSQYKQDVIRTGAFETIQGEILEQAFPFHVESTGQSIQIRSATVHTIMFGSGIASK